MTFEELKALVIEWHESSIEYAAETNLDNNVRRINAIYHLKGAAHKFIEEREAKK